MEANEYQRLALRTESVNKAMERLEVVDSPWNPVPLHLKQLLRLLHGAIGVGTEGGELLDQVKKHLYYGKALDKANVMEECGDVLWYVAVALDAVGFTMEEAMERNIGKLRARYPGNFTTEAALNRDLEAERKTLEKKP